MKKEEFNKILADRLAKFFKYKKISQKQVAEKLDVTSAAVSMWLSGTNEISNSTIWSLMNEFDIDSDYLFGNRQAYIIDFDEVKDLWDLDNKLQINMHGSVLEIEKTIKLLKQYIMDFAYSYTMLEDGELEVYLKLLKIIEDKIEEKKNIILNHNKKEQDQ